MPDKVDMMPEALRVTSKNGNVDCSYATDIPSLGEAIATFEATLPGWWWQTGTCSISRDASCGPDRNGQDANLLFLNDRNAGKLFDEGFHVDLDEEGATVAQALMTVMKIAIEAKAEHGGGTYTWPV